MFVLNSFRKTWPFLLISIPLATAINMTNVSGKIKGLMGKRPLISIIMATLLGALSPLCSCSVIPVIFSLLTAGVPIGPVMSFWIASPSMDPEIFFLSVTTLGWNLAIWRLAATFVLSLGAGFLAHYAFTKGWFKEGILRSKPVFEQSSISSLLKKLRPSKAEPLLKEATIVNVSPLKSSSPLMAQSEGGSSCGCNSLKIETPAESSCGCNSTKTDKAKDSSSCGCGSQKKDSLTIRIIKESLKSFIFVGKFLVIAYVIEALIVLYIPGAWIQTALGTNGSLSVVISTLFGLPFYTNNLAALGLLGGLLEKGMVPAGALAFLISGPTTTLPAMSAVYGICKSRVFAMYLSISFVGALVAGFIYLLVG